MSTTFIFTTSTFIYQNSELLKLAILLLFDEIIVVAYHTMQVSAEVVFD